MGLKVLTPVESLCTFSASRNLLITPPHLELEMLGVFMSFPIIFTTKSLVTVREGTAIGFRVAFFMFSSPMLPLIAFDKEKVRGGSLLVIAEPGERLVTCLAAQLGTWTVARGPVTCWSCLQ